MIKRTVDKAFQSAEQGNEIAAVFHCPTQRESDVGLPVVGATGENLSALLRMLRVGKQGVDYLAWSRSSIMIVNLSVKVNETEKTLRRLANDKNCLRRLEGLLAGQKTILCFGQWAARACERIYQVDNNVKVVSVYHLSPHALNQIVKTKDGRLIEDSIELNPRFYRIKVIADYVCRCLSDDTRHLFTYDDFVDEIKKLRVERKRNGNHHES